MISLLLSNWKLILIAVLAAAVTLFYNLWQEEVKDFAEFKGAIIVLGQEAEKEAKRVNELHAQTLKETNDEWTKALPKVGSNAVANYKRRFPNSLCGDVGKVPLPGNADSTKTPNGTESERVAAGDTFVTECGKDAAKLKSLRSWVQGNQLPVEK